MSIWRTALAMPKRRKGETIADLMLDIRKASEIVRQLSEEPKLESAPAPGSGNDRRPGDGTLAVALFNLQVATIVRRHPVVVAAA